MNTLPDRTELSSWAWFVEQVKFWALAFLLAVGSAAIGCVLAFVLHVGRT